MDKELSLDNEFSRRDFLKLSTGSAAAITLAGLTPALALAKTPLAAGKSITLSECVRMSPAAMAQKSAMVKKGYDYLVKSCSLIADPTYRSVSLESLKNPTPKIMALFPSNSEKESVKKELVAAGYLKPETTYDQFLPPSSDPLKNVQPFTAAPGSGWKSHHAYPGGLVTHVAVFLKSALGLFDAYDDVYGYQMNRDLIVAAAMIHDAQKPWVFQWMADSSCLPESPIAGSGCHHVLSIAEAMYRELSPELIMTIACCHMHPGSPAGEAEVVGWLKAAGIMAGRDPVRLGVLAADGKTLPLPRRQEGFVCHIGDHDYVLTGPACQWMVAKLGEIARRDYAMSDADLQGRPFNSFRNYLFSQASVKRLHQIWVEKGEGALTETVKGMISV
jgi:hypothetical protein